MDFPIHGTNRGIEATPTDFSTVTPSERKKENVVAQ